MPRLVQVAHRVTRRNKHLLHQTDTSQPDKKRGVARPTLVLRESTGMTRIFSLVNRHEAIAQVIPSAIGGFFSFLFSPISIDSKPTSSLLIRLPLYQRRASGRRQAVSGSTLFCGGGHSCRRNSGDDGALRRRRTVLIE